MPSDLTLDLNPLRTPPPPPPSVQVMTRVLRLPTGSSRQARSIVRMQLDRLSPLPAQDTAFDLVALHKDGDETVYALGICRRSSLADPAFATQRAIVVPAVVEGHEITFRFRNAGAVSGQETRWLAHAPVTALIALGIAGVALAADLRAGQWRERRLPEIAAERRLETQEARQAQQAAAAVQTWTTLERADAATRYLCVADRIGQGGGRVPVQSIEADARSVVFAPVPGPGAQALATAGGQGVDPATGQASVVTFPDEVCG